MDSIITRLEAKNPLTGLEECRQYDYGFLANIPKQCHIVECDKIALPLPSERYRGSLAFAYDARRQERRVYICLKQKGQLQWVSCCEPRLKLLVPRIWSYREKLSSTTIWYIDSILPQPSIERYIDTLVSAQINEIKDILNEPLIWERKILNNPIVERYIDSLGRVEIVILKEGLSTPEIEEYRKLDTPKIYYEVTIPLHPAILGQAVLGQCYLGEITLGTAVLGEAKLGECQLGLVD